MKKYREKYRLLRDAVEDLRDFYHAPDSIDSEVQERFELILMTFPKAEKKKTTKSFEEDFTSDELLEPLGPDFRNRFYEARKPKT